MKNREKPDRLPFSALTIERMVMALFDKAVNDLRLTGVTDRTIARRLNVPRWMVRSVK